MFNWFKKKETIPHTNDIKLTFKNKGLYGGEQVELRTPITNAIARLEGKAEDKGSSQGIRLYNEHKVNLQNQWINAVQGINTGYGTAHNTAFLYQTVNYFECYQLEQDALFKKIFNILSQTPISKKGMFEDGKDYEEISKKYKIWETLEGCLRESFISGGCLLFLDFGDSQKLNEPLDLANTDFTKFKGFVRIDPINLAPVETNTSDPSARDYMQPQRYYAVGLGVVHISHFLKFEQNVPPLMMKPLTLFFGTPLTQIIKQDVANANISSQSIANLLGRMRYQYLKTDLSHFADGNAQNFRDRLEVMGMIQNDFSISPLGLEEDISQLVMTVTGLPDVGRHFYQLLASKTGITMSMLYGEGSQGLSGGSLEGERANFYDQCRNIQNSITYQTVKMFEIANAVETGTYEELKGFVWNSLESINDIENAQSAKAYLEIATMATQIGVTPESCLDWLKQFKNLNFETLQIGDYTEGEMDLFSNEDDILDEESNGII